VRNRPNAWGHTRTCDRGKLTTTRHQAGALEPHSVRRRSSDALAAAEALRAVDRVMTVSWRLKLQSFPAAIVW
jgi:hypothetical protein